MATLAADRLPPRLGPTERRVFFALLVGIALWGSIGVDYDSRFEGNPVDRDTRRRRSLPPPPVISQSAPDPEAQRGAEIFAANGCGACHSIDGSTRIGPTLAGIWGTEQAMIDGSSALVDDAYVRESILLPQAREVSGYDAQMPSYEGLVTDSDIAALTAYIQTLD